MDVIRTNSLWERHACRFRSRRDHGIKGMRLMLHFGRVYPKHTSTMLMALLLAGLVQAADRIYRLHNGTVVSTQTKAPQAKSRREEA
jgi:hypothetical protein